MCPEQARADTLATPESATDAGASTRKHRRALGENRAMTWAAFVSADLLESRRLWGTDLIISPVYIVNSPKKGGLR